MTVDAPVSVIVQLAPISIARFAVDVVMLTLLKLMSEPAALELTDILIFSLVPVRV